MTKRKRDSERYDYLEEVSKFNPYHGYHGYFTTAGNATSMTYKPGKSTAHDKAIEREKLRTAAGDYANEYWDSYRMEARENELREMYKRKKKRYKQAVADFYEYARDDDDSKGMQEEMDAVYRRAVHNKNGMKRILDEHKQIQAARKYKESRPNRKEMTLF